MSDIVCYTRPQVLVGLQLAANIAETYNEEAPQWVMLSPPKELNPGDKAYFACEKEIKGYFTISAVGRVTKKSNRKKLPKGAWIILTKWKDIEPINIKDFKKETGGSWRYISKVFKKIKENSDDY